MKKYLTIFTSIIIVVFLYVIFSIDNNSEFLDYYYADIDMDNEDEMLAITYKKGSKYGNKFIILERNSSENSWIMIYENDFSKIKPWKIEVADVDGDNVLEIAIGVYKSTIYDKKERNRLFIFNYNYQDKILVKKWTGSKLENDLVDFYFEDIISAKGLELITKEKSQLGDNITNAYYWFGFGFKIIENY